MSGWGETFNRALARGHDHSSAALVADDAEARAELARRPTAGDLGDENERLRAALRFYARREHWTALGSDPDLPSMLLTAASGPAMDGWSVAETALTGTPAPPEETTRG